MKFSYREFDARLRFFLSYFEHVRIIPLSMATGATVISTFSRLDIDLIKQQIITFAGPKRWEFDKFTYEFLAQAMCLDAYTHLNNGKITHTLAPHRPMSMALNDGPTSAIVLAIQDQLPCPRNDVPISEIIDFRDKNKNELDILFTYLERSARQISHSSSPEEIYNIITKETGNFVSNIIDIYKKSKIPFSNISAEFSFDVSSIAFATLASIISPILTPVAGAISIAIKKSKIPAGNNFYPTAFEIVSTGIKKKILNENRDISEFEWQIDNMILAKFNASSFYDLDRLSELNIRDSIFSDIVTF